MNITEVIEQLVIEYDQDPYDINNGSCDCFAMDVIERMGDYSDDLYEIWDDDICHCFIFYEGKYYDAECPEGVNGQFDLPIFVRNSD